MFIVIRRSDLLAYDSYYKRTDDEQATDKDKDKTATAKPQSTKVSITGPLTFWIGILLIAALLQLVAIPFANSYSHTVFNNYFNDFANYVLYIPGLIVLPLIVALWVGDRVSYVESNNKSFIVSKGVVNALYTSLVYIVSIFIIYLIMSLVKLGVLHSLTLLPFVEYLILCTNSDKFGNDTALCTAFISKKVRINC